MSREFGGGESRSVNAKGDRDPIVPISLRARLLRSALRFMKNRQTPRQVPTAAVRERLKLIERFVPGPPAGTKTTPIDVDGIKAVRVDVRGASPDGCVLYFHGGGYTVGTAPLYRDFTWRIGVAACAPVLFFEYRLAPEYPFPAAVEDAAKVYHWLAGQVASRKIAFIGDSAGGGLALATLLKLRDDGKRLPAAAVALS